MTDDELQKIRDDHDRLAQILADVEAAAVKDLHSLMTDPAVADLVQRFENICSRCRIGGQVHTTISLVPATMMNILQFSSLKLAELQDNTGQRQQNPVSLLEHQPEISDDPAEGDE